MNYFTPLNALNPTETQELLYAYSGAPPVAYGSRTKAVLENISRPYEYYKNGITEEEILALKTAEKHIHQITLRTPSAGFNPVWVSSLSKAFIEKHTYALTRLKTWLEKEMPHLPYCELAKGRQTWSFLRKRNVPAPNALEETIEFLELNLNRKIGRTLLDYNQAILDVFELETTSYTLHLSLKRTDIDLDLEDMYQSEAEVVSERYRKKVKLTITREHLFNQLRKLNTMWKHFERGRKNRRTIATGSMLLRGFVKIVEDAARVLLENIESSGLPVGGEEKLAKLASKLILDKSEFTGELSGDQEKWNECLDPDCMRLMWTIFLNHLKVPGWIVEMFNFAFLIFKAKTADMGEGLVYTASGMSERHCLGEKASEFDKFKKLIVEEDGKQTNDIACRMGMFMGMFNFTSTLVALIAADSPLITGNHVESSDDYIHFAYCETKEKLFSQVETLRRLFKMVGVNMSAPKTLFVVPMGIGEFNSKYHFLDFVGNVATELPALVPIGNNPMTDLSMGLQTIKNSLVTFQMMFPTAHFALKIFCKAYKHAYMIEGTTKRTKFIEENNIPKLLLYTGADPVHSISTLHLDEIAFRHQQKLITDDELGKLLNPENPFTGGGDPAFTLRIESRMPLLTEDCSLGSIYKFKWARNRTILHTTEIPMLEKEKMYQEMTSLVQNTFPEVLVGIRGITGTVKNAVKQRLKMLIETSQCSLEEKVELLSDLES